MAQETYLITGASRGIGRATAVHLCRANPKLRILATARNAAALAELETELQDSPGDCFTFPFDLEAEDYGPLFAWISSHGPLSGIFCNAGLLLRRPFAETTDADWQRIFAVNLFGPVKLARGLASHLAKGAHLVNIGTVGGFQGSSKFSGLSAYSVSKAAVAALSECLAEEWKEQQISVNCLAFGAVQTEMLATAFPGYQAPLRSEEMAEFASWFLTKGGQFFNGKVLPVALNNP